MFYLETATTAATELIGATGPAVARQLRFSIPDRCTKYILGVLVSVLE